MLAVLTLFEVKEMRIFPRRIYPGLPGFVRPHPRVKVLRIDHQGFTIVEAKLTLGEDVCYECGYVVSDPGHKLIICPICNGFFND